MPTYRAAIVGLSWIAADPAGPATDPALGTAPPFSHASAYAALPNVEVVAGCDINPAACEEFTARWSDHWPGVKTYADYRVMLDHERIDLLSVVTPDHLHAGIMIAAAQSGVRGIFCEKPLASSLADADAMIAAADAAGAVVNVNHTRRWQPSWVAARRCLRDGGIGDLATIVAHYGGPRAMLWRNHSHLLDAICSFVDSDPEWVIAELESGLKDYGTEYKGDGGRDPNTEPGVNAYIAFANGVRAFLSGMKHATNQFRADVYGRDGRIVVEEHAATRIAPGEHGPVSTPLVPRNTMGGMQAGIADLIAALESGRPVQCPPAEARKTVALIQAILESQVNGNTPVKVR